MKTAKLTIENYKDTSLGEVLFTLFYSKFEEENKDLDEDEISDKFHEKYKDIFEYDEYGNFEIEIDENLNIVGGRVVPFKEL